MHPQNPYQQQPQHQQPQYQQQPPPQYQQPPPPPPGLVPPLGPPERVPGAVRVTALVLLGVAALGLSVFAGYEVALNGGNRLQVLLWFLPAILTLAASVFVAQDNVWSPRSDGWVLEGTGLLGRQGIDLTRLTSVASAANARAVQLVLRDDVGALTVDARSLGKAGPALHDVVGRAVWAGQEQGRYVVPRGVAAVWGMPTRPDAPARGRTGATPKALAVLGVVLVGTVVGVVLALA